MPKELVDRILVWHDSKKYKLDNIGASTLNYPWASSHIRNDVDIAHPCIIHDSIPGNPWNKEFVDLFPGAIKYFDQLPLINIARIVLLESTKEVLSHVDRSKSHIQADTLEPASYRMHLRGCEKQGFYVQGKPLSEWGSARAITPVSAGFTHLTKPLPIRFWQGEIGRWWLLNNFCAQHGSTYEPGDNKVIISVQGTPDPVRHRELLKECAKQGLNCRKHEELYKYEEQYTPEEKRAFERLINETKFNDHVW
jgi:hypothetical protein